MFPLLLDFFHHTIALWALVHFSLSPSPFSLCIAFVPLSEESLHLSVCVIPVDGMFFKKLMSAKCGLCALSFPLFFGGVELRNLIKSQG